MVGAPGFEPGASCAQGRRATRLRYAPTLCALMILLYFSPFLPAIYRATVHELCRYRSHLSYCAQLSVAQTIENNGMHFTMRAVEGSAACQKSRCVLFDEDSKISIYSTSSEYTRETGKENVVILELVQYS
jgi:hypothetical protein